MNPKSQQPEDELRRKTGPPRKYSEEFRQQALERMKSCDNVAGLARELGVRRKWLYHWRDQAAGRVPERRPGWKPKEAVADREHKRIAELERLVARQTPDGEEESRLRDAMQRTALENRH